MRSKCRILCWEFVAFVIWMEIDNREMLVDDYGDDSIRAFNFVNEFLHKSCVIIHHAKHARWTFFNVKIKLTNEMRYNSKADWHVQHIIMRRPSICALSHAWLFGHLGFPIAKKLEYTESPKRYNLWINHLENLNFAIESAVFRAASINSWIRTNADERLFVNLMRSRKGRNAVPAKNYRN